jgi:hypothetical protein
VIHGTRGQKRLAFSGNAIRRFQADSFGYTQSFFKRNKLDLDTLKRPRQDLTDRNARGLSQNAREKQERLERLGQNGCKDAHAIGYLRDALMDLRRLMRHL